MQIGIVQPIYRHPEAEVLKFKSSQVSCYVCDQEVDLGRCITDENGSAMHGNCYLLKLQLHAATQ